MSERTTGGLVKFAWMEDDLFTPDELAACAWFWLKIARSRSRRRHR